MEPRHSKRLITLLDSAFKCGNDSNWGDIQVKDVFSTLWEENIIGSTWQIKSILFECGGLL